MLNTQKMDVKTATNKHSSVKNVDNFGCHTVDDVNAYLECWQKMVTISKLCGGIGIDCSNIRSK